jgi:predicted lysophospholipase L1 biosynthesis ABC-type transport system permease subunit
MDYGNRNIVVGLWMVITVMGSAIGLFFGSMAGEQLGFPLGAALEASLQRVFSSFPSDYAPSMVAGFLYGAVSGFFPGFVQWLAVLRVQYRRSGIWIFLNLFGLAIAFSLNSGLYAFVISFIGDDLLVNLIYAVMNGLVTGSIMGFLQWMFFSRKHPRAYWWLVLNIIGWGMQSFIGFMGLMFGGRFFWLLEFVFILVDSIAWALITGTALYITFPQPIQKSEQDTMI